LLQNELQLGCYRYYESKEEFQGYFQSIVDFDDANVVKRAVGNADGGIKFELVIELVEERIRGGGFTTLKKV
jgi:hypothetical protein